MKRTWLIEKFFCENRDLSNRIIKWMPILKTLDLSNLLEHERSFSRSAIRIESFNLCLWKLFSKESEAFGSLHTSLIDFRIRNVLSGSHMSLLHAGVWLKSEFLGFTLFCLVIIISRQSMAIKLRLKSTLKCSSWCLFVDAHCPMLVAWCSLPAFWLCALEKEIDWRAGLDYLNCQC